MAGFEEDRMETERDAIYQSTKDMAGSLRSRPIIGSELDAGVFTEVLKSAPWFHYHGHVDYVKSEAVKQSFVLSGKLQNSNPQYTGSSQDQSEADIKPLERKPTGSFNQDASLVTVANLFTMDLSANAPVICSIACDSGIQDIGPSEEPLGLVSALLAAGATSVLGTLWPIQSSCGKEFSKIFYGKILDQVKKQENFMGEKVLNLAFALHKTVLQMKADRKKRWKAPYFWAPFVLHGAGFYVY
jgi:CHAT domain-containing protein